MLTDIRGGVRIVVRAPFLRYTTGWVAVTNLVGGSVMLLAIALLQKQGAVANHPTRALDILRTPVEDVPEIAAHRG